MSVKHTYSLYAHTRTRVCVRVIRTNAHLDTHDMQVHTQGQGNPTLKRYDSVYLYVELRLVRLSV